MRQFSSSCLTFLAACVIASGMAHGQTNDQPLDLIEDMNGNVLITDSDVFEILSRTSLMLTSDQKTQVELAKVAALELMLQRDTLADIQEDALFTEALASRDFVLDAIMYLGPTTWTIWINGQAFKPDRVPEDVRVVAVTPGSAEIIWFADPENPADVRQFKLFPGQMYMADSGEIVEASQRLSTAPSGDDTDTGSDDDEVGGDDVAEDRDQAAGPEELGLSAEQAKQLEDLQDALGLIPDGVLPEGQASEIDALKDALDASDGGGLSDDQIQQLKDIQSLIGGGG